MYVEASQEIRIDPIADQIHAKAVATATRNQDYDQAGKLFDVAYDAMFILGDDYQEQEPISFGLQLARIERDATFTQARQSMARLERRDVLALYRRFSAQAFAMRQGLYQCESGLSPWALDYAMSEVGASYGVLARMATFLDLYEVDGQLLPGEANVMAHISEHARKNYDTADLHLRPEGRNRYYATSNAVHAARHAKASAEITTGYWLHEARQYIREAHVYDPDNLRPAVRTYVFRLPDLLTARRARESVRHSP